MAVDMGTACVQAHGFAGVLARLLEIAGESVAMGEIAVHLLDLGTAAARFLERVDRPFEEAETPVAEPQSDPGGGTLCVEGDAAPVAPDGRAEGAILEVAVAKVQVDAGADDAAPLELPQHDARGLDGPLFEALHGLRESIFGVVPHARVALRGRAVCHPPRTGDDAGGRRPRRKPPGETPAFPGANGTADAKLARFTSPPPERTPCPPPTP